MLWQTGSSWSVKRLLWPIVAKLCTVLEGHTGWSSVVSLSWACSLWAGRARPWFSAILNGPWESSVMDSLGLHTLALCIQPSWTLAFFFLSFHVFFFLFLSHNVTHTDTLKEKSHKHLFLPVSSWYKCVKYSFCCKARLLLLSQRDGQ